MKARISLVAALAEKTRAIGKGNNLLWRIPDDLKRFKTLTLGHPVIMGSKTYESIGRPLPDRMNIVLTNDPTWHTAGVTTCTSLEEALDMAASHDVEEVFVIGGGSVYAQTVAQADRLYLTLVADNAEGDVYFPAYAHLDFQEVAHEARHYGNLSYTWITLERKQQKQTA